MKFFSLFFLRRRRRIWKVVLILIVLWFTVALLTFNRGTRNYLGVPVLKYEDVEGKSLKMDSGVTLRKSILILMESISLLIREPSVSNHEKDNDTLETLETLTVERSIAPDDASWRAVGSDSGPGELGKPVVLPENITEDIKAAVAEGWEKNIFNQYVSDLISVRRKLPDPRNEWCKQPGRYSKDLPQTSVVICFHNEAWSVLLRTVHSVLDRSPAHLIKEIILVDDFSDMPHLKQQLDDYMCTLPKVRIVRATRREGLIRARLLGLRYVTASVLTYLDSHCECTKGWLEPLLDRIARDKTTVVCPVIDIINDNTLEYYYQDTPITSIGGFDWNLQFKWQAIPARELARREHAMEPLWSPAMAGGLFAIDKEFFERLGTYDSGLDIWGLENLELSFKSWMCGGTLEIIPCSHVGHIFRKHSPYKWPNDTNVLKRNSVRLAEVWMDDYAKYYYQRVGNDKGDFGNISSRVALRQKLGCKSFEWYLKNIYPELLIPGEAIAHGEYWMYTKSGEIRRDDGCVDFFGHDVMLYPCHGGSGNQLWLYDPNTTLLKHIASEKCMGINRDKDAITMEDCNEEEPRQMWIMENFRPDRLDPESVLV